MFELQCIMFYYEKKRYLTFTNDSRESINRLINGYGMSTYEPAFFFNGERLVRRNKVLAAGPRNELLRGNIKLTLLLHLQALMASNG